MRSAEWGMRNPHSAFPIPRWLVALATGLPALPPLGAMFDDPVGQRALEADIVAGLFGLNPLMLEDFIPFGLELLVQGRVPKQVCSVLLLGILILVGHERQRLF